MAKKRKYIRKGKSLPRLGSTVAPVGFDGRTKEGRRFKQYSLDLYLATPDSETPLVRSRIAAAAAALVYAEHLAWRIDRLGDESIEKVIEYGIELRKADEAAHRALERLKGKGVAVGHRKADGAPASDVGPRSRNLGKRILKNGIDSERPVH